MGILKKAWLSFHLPPSHQRIPSSNTIPGPTTTSHTARSHNISVFPHHPPSYPEHIPSPNIFLPHPLSPNLHKTSPPTTPALKRALPAAPPARLQSCPCLHAPVTPPSPRPHNTRPPVSYTRILSRTSQAPPQLEQTPPPPHQGRNLPFCHQASHCPLTSNIPQHILKQSIPTSLRTSPAPTHPPRPHSLTKDARDGPLPVRHMQPPDPAPSHRPHPISSQAIDT